jgi:hypothetical protein
MKKIFAALAATVSLASIAQAATVNLSNISVNSSGKTVVATESTTLGTVEIAIEATLTDWSLSQGLHFDPVSGLRSYNGGVGINRNKSDWHTVDGKGPNEAVLITAKRNGIDLAIRLTSLEFAFFGSQADFDLYASTGSSFTRIIDDQNIAAGNPALLNELGTAFAVGADSDHCGWWSCADHDSFKLKSFSYELLPDIDTQVPVPGALPLMLAGLGGFAAMRKRKAQQAD